MFQQSAQKILCSDQEKGIIKGPVKPSSLFMKLFKEELKNLYRAQKIMTNAIPAMIKNAGSRELVKAITNHLAETAVQVDRLERALNLIVERTAGKFTAA